MRGARSALRLAVAFCALGANASAAGAQATVRSARLQADLRGGAEAVVRVEYLLSGVLPGDSVGVSLLDFGAAPSELVVGDAGEAVRVAPAGGAARRARVVVGPAPDEGGRLVVAYRVAMPATGRRGTQVVRFPVPTVDHPAEAARPGLFQAEVRAPAAWRVAEAFPTGLAPAADGGALLARLPVVPSVVTLRFRADGGRAFPLPLVLNLAVAGCLAVVGVAGWRQLAPRRP